MLLAACSFRVNGAGDEGMIDASTDADIDAPPLTTDVKFTQITSNVTQIAPGRYGFTVTAVLRNELDAPIDDIRASLTFHDGTTDRVADFRWRDFDRRDGSLAAQPSTIGPDQEATFQFKVDALPWAIPPGPVLVNGSATFSSAGTPLSASASATPLSLEFSTINETITVTITGDEDDGDTDVSLREAITRANNTAGLDRIVFSPAVFPEANPATITLDESLGALPDVNQSLVIDARGAGVAIAVNVNWEMPEGRYGLKLAAGTLVVYGLIFRNLAFNYRNEGNLDSANCGTSNAQLEGGAIRVDGGTLILERNRFVDPAVAERNCYAASVRLEGGSGHRILENQWGDQVMDAIYVDAATIEISNNVMNAGANLSRVDECIFIASQGGMDLWITGNVCVDQEYSAIAAGGTDAGALYVVNNTFARNGRQSLSAVRRSNGQRAITFRNNLYIANNPAGILGDNGGGGLNIAYETAVGTPLCEGTSCAGSTIDTPTILLPSNAMVTDAAGTTRAAFSPQPGSPLLDSGVDWIDRNGPAPGRFRGAATDRGAIEAP